MSHKEWITAFLARTGSPLGRCAEAVAEMHAAFPDLRVVKGHVLCAWGRRQHWWLETSDGTKVDPTVEQFPGGSLGVMYEEYEDGQPLRIGKCMDCGGDINVYSMAEAEKKAGSSSVCSAACADSLRQYLKDGLL